MALVKATQSLFPGVEEKVTNLLLCEYAEMLRRMCSEAERWPLVFGGERFRRILRVLDGFCETGKFVVMTHSSRTARLETSVPLRGLES